MKPPPSQTSPRAALRALFASPAYRRLWMMGGLGNATRWVEVLAAGLFTLQVTGSAMAVAAVTAARSLPLLCFGALAGLLSESLDRTKLLRGVQAVMAAASLAVLVLALLGLARAWHLGLASFCSGLVWATEPSLRRRMAAEAAGPELMPRAVALDSVTQAVMRAIGPVLGSSAYAAAGLAGAYALSSALNLVSVTLATGVSQRQEVTRFSLLKVPRDLAEAASGARALPAVMGVLGVTIAMNSFGFSYSALVAPIGQEAFGASPVLVGVLASCEATGALLGGIALTAWPPVRQRDFFLGGSLLFLACLALVPFAPGFWWACGLLVLGGTGTAAFSNQQTTLVLSHAPAPMRSRLLGLLAMCIGTGPLGQLLMGAASARLGLLGAVEACAMLGLASVLLAAAHWVRRERPARPRPAALAPAVRPED